MLVQHHLERRPLLLGVTDMEVGGVAGSVPPPSGAVHVRCDCFNQPLVGI